MGYSLFCLGNVLCRISHEFVHFPTNFLCIFLLSDMLDLCGGHFTMAMHHGGNFFTPFGNKRYHGGKVSFFFTGITLITSVDMSWIGWCNA